MAVEEPRYTVLVSEPPFEVRRYAAFTVAQTQISGDFDAASRNGFRRIASYIFGDNVQAEVGAQRKISMTAPVTAIIAYDPKFYEQLPKLFPHNPDAKSWSREGMAIHHLFWQT